MSDKRPALFFQRFARHLSNQDWSAAAIELALVVLGVFLGFQLTQWNDDRHDRAREQTYLLNVADDLRGDVIEMDENTRTAASRMAALDRLLVEAGGWTPPATFPSSRYLIRVENVPAFDDTAGYTVGIETFILSTLDGNRFAYNTLINADGLGVIRDQALLREIQSYYASVDEVLDFEASLEDNRLRLLDEMQQAGLSAVSRASMKDVAASLRARPPLRAAAENYWLYANRHVFLTRALSARGATLAGRIEESYAPAN